MKLKLGKLISLLMVAVMLCGSVITSQAAPVSESAELQSVSPRYAHCNYSKFIFNISEDGVGCFRVTYTGSSTFDRALLTVKFEKRFLGVFWQTVDISEPNDEWSCASYVSEGVFYDEIALDGTGTYRAVFTLEIRGTDGTTDVIEQTIERVYN